MALTQTRRAGMCRGAPPLHARSPTAMFYQTAAALRTPGPEDQLSSSLEHCSHHTSRGSPQEPHERVKGSSAPPTSSLFSLCCFYFRTLVCCWDFVLQKDKKERLNYMHVMLGSSAYGSMIVLSKKAVTNTSLNPSSKYEALISIIEDILLLNWTFLPYSLDIWTFLLVSLNSNSRFSQFMGTVPNIS